MSDNNEVVFSVTVSRADIEQALKVHMDKVIQEYVKSFVTNWARGTSIQREIEATWGRLIGPIVEEEMRKSDALREDIQKKLRHKLEAQLRTLLSKQYKESQEEVDSEVTTS